MSEAVDVVGGVSGVGKSALANLLTGSNAFRENAFGRGTIAVTRGGNLVEIPGHEGTAVDSVTRLGVCNELMDRQACRSLIYTLGNRTQIGRMETQRETITFYRGLLGPGIVTHHLALVVTGYTGYDTAEAEAYIRRTAAPMFGVNPASLAIFYISCHPEIDHNNRNATELPRLREWMARQASVPVDVAATATSLSLPEDPVKYIGILHSYDGQTAQTMEESSVHSWFPRGKKGKDDRSFIVFKINLRTNVATLLVDHYAAHWCDPFFSMIKKGLPLNFTGINWDAMSGIVHLAGPGATYGEAPLPPTDRRVAQRLAAVGRVVLNLAIRRVLPNA